MAQPTSARSIANKSALKKPPNDHSMDEEFEFFEKKFATNYVDTLITKMLENEIIPDLLIETLSEMSLDPKNPESKYKYDLPSDHYMHDATTVVKKGSKYIDTIGRPLIGKLSYDGKDLTSKTYSYESRSENMPAYDLSKPRLAEDVHQSRPISSLSYRSRNQSPFERNNEPPKPTPLDLFMIDQAIERFQMDNRHKLNYRGSDYVPEPGNRVIEPTSRSVSRSGSRAAQSRAANYNDLMGSGESLGYVDNRAISARSQRSRPQSSRTVNGSSISMNPDTINYSLLSTMVDDFIHEYFKREIMPAIAEDVLKKAKAESVLDKRIETKKATLLEKHTHVDVVETAKEAIERYDRNRKKYTSHDGKKLDDDIDKIINGGYEVTVRPAMPERRSKNGTSTVLNENGSQITISHQSRIIPGLDEDVSIFDTNLVMSKPGAKVGQQQHTVARFKPVKLRNF